jgi:hypothetical protein
MAVPLKRQPTCKTTPSFSKTEGEPSARHYSRNTRLTIGAPHSPPKWRPVLYAPAPLPPSQDLNGGVADSLDEAKAGFRAVWERPLSPEKADKKCSL